MQQIDVSTHREISQVMNDAQIVKRWYKCKVNIKESLKNWLKYNTDKYLIKWHWNVICLYKIQNLNISDSKIKRNKKKVYISDQI